MKTRLASLLAPLLLLGAGASQAALVTVLPPDNGVLTNLSYNVVEGDANPYQLNISVTYASAGLGLLQISDLFVNVPYLVTMTITNNSGASFTRIANELLDASGDGDDALDPVPQPGFVPAGWSTSNNSDGLNFAQGVGLPRDSTVFTGVAADELTDERDFLDFFNGDFANGQTRQLRFGLLASTAGLQPFVLLQRPNQRSTPDPDPNKVPEPATLLLAGLGLLGAGLARRRRAA